MKNEELVLDAGCRNEAEIPLLRDWMLDAGCVGEG
jgi:hypothetical protein